MVTEESNEAENGNDDPLEPFDVMNNGLPGDKDPEKAWMVRGEEPGNSSNGVEDSGDENVEGVTNAPVRVEVGVDTGLCPGHKLFFVIHPVVLVEFLKPVHRAQNGHRSCNCKSGLLRLIKCGDSGISRYVFTSCGSGQDVDRELVDKTHPLKIKIYIYNRSLEVVVFLSNNGLSAAS